MKVYTKEELISILKRIKEMGWVKCSRPSNDGCVGNTLEDLIGIDENNLPIANSGEWELKAQRAASKSLMTLLHWEPSPRAVKFVPNILLPIYGWTHKTIPNEMSFRQTIKATQRTDRGFIIRINEEKRRVELSFDATAVDPKHAAWLKEVERRAGLGEIDPQPYWGFDDLYHKLGSKLSNCVYAKAEVKIEDEQRPSRELKKSNKAALLDRMTLRPMTRIDGKRVRIEYYNYNKIYMLEKLDQEKILKAMKEGKIYIDFDARTRHNHGTKFRMVHNILPELYSNVIEI